MIIKQPRQRSWKFANPRKSKKSCVLIVDDHPLIGEGMKNVIGTEAELEVCGEARNAGEAFDALTATTPDVVVLDISLADNCGIELCRRIKDEHPQVRVVVCSIHDEAVVGVRCLRAGADGFASKHDPPATLIKAIQQVLRGEYCFSPSVTQQLLRTASPSSGQSKPTEPSECLSDRQLQVFRLIGAGRNTRQIASELSVSVKTVESHRQNIKRKLDLLDSVQLTHAAVRWVLGPPTSHR